MIPNSFVLFNGLSGTAKPIPKGKKLTFSGKFLEAIEANYTQYEDAPLIGGVFWPEDEAWVADLGKSGTPLYPVLSVIGRERPVAAGEKFVSMASRKDPDILSLALGQHDYFKAPSGDDTGGYTINFKCAVTYDNSEGLLDNAVIGAYNLLTIKDMSNSFDHIRIEQEVLANGALKTQIHMYDYHAKANLGTYVTLVNPTAPGEYLEYELTVGRKFVSFAVKDTTGTLLGNKFTSGELYAYNDSGNCNLFLLDARAGKWLRDREVRVHDLQITRNE